ncbi:MAG: hypothetical protein GY787_19235 [Alteromonadales bacterium]|nr:hypothetical protein [Alteromonadales bacterium]
MQLLEKGLSLVKDLNAEASKYSVRSTVHEILSWESVGVKTRVDDLKNGNVEARNDTRYENINWGERLVKYKPKLAGSVRDFYNEYYGLKNT